MSKNVIHPEYLKAGDSVAVVAPSGVVDRERIEDAIKVLKAWGLKILLGEHLYNSFGIFAGNDEERLSDLQWALDSIDIKAIFFARGGYGLSRIIDKVDYHNMIKHPKWIAGFSDITLLHFHIYNNTGIPVIHSEMLLNLSGNLTSEKSISTLKDFIFKGESAYQWDCDNVICGEIKAEVAGGNLSMLCSIPGKQLADYLKDKILFIEETGEHLYRIDRLLLSLKHEGVFDGIGGLIVGGISDIPSSRTNFGYTVEEIVLNALGREDIPVAFGFPAGHIRDNRALCFGLEYFFRVDSLSAVLALTLI